MLGFLTWRAPAEAPSTVLNRRAQIDMFDRFWFSLSFSCVWIKCPCFSGSEDVGPGVVASTRNIRVAREPGKLVPLVRAGHGALGTLVPLTMI